MAISVNNDKNGIPPIIPRPATVTFAYYLVNENDVITSTLEAEAGGNNLATVSKAAGDLLVITTKDNGFSNQKWNIDGAEDAGKQGQASYTFSSRDKTAKRYNISLDVEKENKYYIVKFTIMVVE